MIRIFIYSRKVIEERAIFSLNMLKQLIQAKITSFIQLLFYIDITLNLK